MVMVMVEIETCRQQEQASGTAALVQEFHRIKLMSWTDLKAQSFVLCASCLLVDQFNNRLPVERIATGDLLPYWGKRQTKVTLEIPRAH